MKIKLTYLLKKIWFLYTVDRVSNRLVLTKDQRISNNEKNKHRTEHTITPSHFPIRNIKFIFPLRPFPFYKLSKFHPPDLLCISNIYLIHISYINYLTLYILLYT